MPYRLIIIFSIFKCLFYNFYISGFLQIPSNLLGLQFSIDSICFQICNKLNYAFLIIIFNIILFSICFK